MKSRFEHADDASDRGLLFSQAAAMDATPGYFQTNVGLRSLELIRSVGIGARSTLKASFWNSRIEEAEISGDPNYASVVLHRGGGRVWRNNERQCAERGSVGMQPFEGSRWRFEGPVGFVHVYVPFLLLARVCESIFDRDLMHTELSIPMGTRDARLCGAMTSIETGLLEFEPTNLILDSWALILSDILLRRFSRHANGPARATFGKMPPPKIARVVDYIEANIDQDLDLAALAGVASMSVYHFARRFKDTLGVSPHAYVVSRRVRRAESLLRRRNLEIVQVAAACGFSSQAHLTTTFLNSLGTTPGRYRRLFAR